MNYSCKYHKTYTDFGVYFRQVSYRFGADFLGHLLKMGSGNVKHPKECDSHEKDGCHHEQGWFYGEK